MGGGGATGKIPTNRSASFSFLSHHRVGQMDDKHDKLSHKFTTLQWTILKHKNEQIRYLGSKTIKIAFVARSSLGELTALPRPLIGCPGDALRREGEGREGKTGRGGKKGRGGRKGRGVREGETIALPRKLCYIGQ